MLRTASISSVVLLLVLSGPTPVAFAQDQQNLALRLFNQSCRVCHTKPQFSSPQYGPALSKETLGGNADALREFIRNGTARMPGFKYHFKPGGDRRHRGLLEDCSRCRRRRRRHCRETGDSRAKAKIRCWRNSCTISAERSKQASA